jgi:hypothetical protein
LEENMLAMTIVSLCTTRLKSATKIKYMIGLSRILRE